MEIGPGKKQQLDQLRDTLKSAESLIEKPSSAAFEGLINRVEAWAAKVAVIGQVKAGKSTFMNALLGEHDLLPADINPWTSVVTNVRLNLASDPETGAVFEFFAAEDWNEISEGNGAIRKMAEDMLPGFDRDVLRQQSDDMRERAQKRLGKQFDTLLGSTHSFDLLSPELLRRYVCAGSANVDDPEGETLGRYAAVTKRADIFMRQPHFKVPSIVTDTPGVNDPFLVRDEVTCRALDQSDLFIVVLSAHQALTDVDIALIRILAMQRGKDVMIFINRIDELDGYATRVERVIADVAARLKAAIPEVQFKIKAGSAFMADALLRDDDEAEALREELDCDELTAYLRRTHGTVPDTREARLALGAGLDQVREMLSQAIDTGAGGAELAQIQADAKAQIAGAIFAARREREAVQEEIEKLGAQGKPIEEKPETGADTAEQSKALRDLQSRFSDALDAANDELNAIVGEAWVSLERDLNAQVDAFLATERQTLHDQVMKDTFRKGETKDFQVQLTPLHLKLERAVAEGYADVRMRIDEALSRALYNGRKMITERFGDDVESLSLDDLPHDEFSTTLVMTKKTLNISAIAESSWAFWRKKSVDTEKTMQSIRAQASAELQPALLKLLTAFNDAQTERATAGSERLAVMRDMLETTLQGHAQRLDRQKRQLEGLVHNPEKSAKAVRDLQSRLEVLEHRLQRLAVVSSAVSKTQSFERAA